MSTVMKRMTALIVVALLALAGAFVAVSADTAQAAKKPAKVSGVSAKAAPDVQVNVTWKVAKRATTYQVRYATNSKMKKAKSVTVKGAKTTKATVKGLKASTKYYVQVRAKNGKKAGKWSAKKAVTTQKVLPIRANLQAYSWAEVKAIAGKISQASSKSAALATAKTYHLLASDGRLTGNETKTVTLTNGKVATVQILGFWHDDKVGGGKAGITFGFKEILTTHKMNSTETNSGGWTASSMYSWLNSTSDSASPMALLPTDVTSRIAKVSKKANNEGYIGANDPSVVSATSDSLWLPSLSECYGSLSSQSSNVPTYPAVYDAEGTQYQLWSDLGVTTKSYSALRKCAIGSTSSGRWWLRSPDAAYRYNFRSVESDGDWNSVGASDSCGVSPGFCM